jgi:uncharacterized caspase-like protein
MGIVLATFLWLTAGPTLAAERREKPGRMCALLIGVNKYENVAAIDRKDDLKFAENDAQGLGQALRAAGFADEDVVVMTTAEPADGRLSPRAANIRKELRSLLKGLTHADTVLVAFAGYEMQFAGSDEYYICPADADKSDKKTLVSLSELYDELGQAKAGCKIVIVDSCRLLEGRRGAKAPKAPPKGVAVLFACSGGENAFEVPDKKHGVLSYYLREGLRGAADEDGDGQVTWSELVPYVQDRVSGYVKKNLKASQTPVVVGRTGEFQVAVSPKDR